MAGSAGRVEKARANGVQSSVALEGWPHYPQAIRVAAQNVWRVEERTVAGHLKGEASNKPFKLTAIVSVTGLAKPVPRQSRPQLNARVLDGS